VNHSDLPPELKSVYDRREDSQEPPPELRGRTIRALKQRGLLQPERSGMRFPAFAPLAAAAAIGFLVGLGVARSASDGLPPSAEVQSVESALESVQRTGTAHAHALQQLVELLESAEGSTVMEAQQVYAAASRAQRAEARALMAPDNTTSAPRRISTSGEHPTVWF
jgi:hypothetical protein